MRYRISAIPPGGAPVPPLELLPGDSVHVTVEYESLIWEST